MKITSHKLHYRGFELGFSHQTSGNRPAWYAAWRSLSPQLPTGWKLVDGWEVAHVMAKNEIDTIRLARERIDYNYRVEVEEFLLGRKLVGKELPK